MPHRTLILMACSATKRPETRKSTPARDLYDGPLWRTLRTHKPRGLPWSNVVVLSARYGLIGAEDGIGPYEQRLTPAAAHMLIERGCDAPNDQFGTLKHAPAGPSPAELVAHGAPYRMAIVAASGDYRRVFDAMLDGFLQAGICGVQEGGKGARRLTRLYTHGGIGVQREQLGQWLRGMSDAA